MPDNITPIDGNPVDWIDEPQSPYPNNQHFSFDELTLTHSRVWRLQFAWNTSGPPITLDGPFNLRMYYTDDHFVATEADAAHRPIDVISASGFKVGDTIYVAYHKQIAANTWQICLNTFSVATRLWGTEISGGPIVTDAVGRRALYMTVRGGVRYILYNYVDGGIKVGWIKYDGGWSATTQVSGAQAGQTKLPNGIFLDGTLIHFWFKSGGEFPNVAMHLYHRALDAGESLGTTQDLGQLETYWREVYPGPAVTFEGNLMVPYARDTGTPSGDPANPGNNHVPALFVGTTAGMAAPLWASEDVSTTVCDWNSLEEAGAYSVSAAVTPLLGPKLYVFFITPQHIFDTMNWLVQTWRMFGDTVWHESVLYAPTEPTNPELDDWVHNPDVITLEWGGELFIIVDRVNASFTSSEGNEYAESFIIGPPPHENISVSDYVTAALSLPPVVVSDCVATRCKNPVDVIDLEIDWDGWLDTDVIASSSWDGGGLTLGTTAIVGTTCIAKISGGTSGSNYFVRNTITTQEGRADARSILILVRSAEIPAVAASDWWRDQQKG